MKIRSGFVSNSSSSSFILAVKDRDIIEMSNKLRKIFELPPNHPLREFTNFIVDYIVESLPDTVKSGMIDNRDDLQIYLNDNLYTDDLSQWTKELGLLDKGYRLYIGSWSDDHDNNIESFLCNNDLFIDNEDIILEHVGEY